MVEQLNALADDFEFHLYSNRVDDVDLKKMTWHRVPAIPGPLLFRFVCFFLMNHICRWFDRRFRKISIDLVCCPGINCFDAELIAVHIVFAEFRQRANENLRLRRNPLFFWARLIHRKVYYRLIISLEKCIYARQNLPLIAIARKVCADLQRYYGRVQGVSLIYYGVDCQKFNPSIREKLRTDARNAMGYSREDFVVLLVGNDWTKKGLRCLLKAAALIEDRNLKIAVAGKDDPSPFREILSGRLASSVRFFAPRPDPEFFYAAADLYAGPSLEDAFALPPLEAMACGVPVIVSCQAGVSELVTHGEDGYILEYPEQPEELAPLITRLRGDDELRRHMGEKASETARQYTWERNTARFREVLLSVWSKKQSRQFAKS